MTVSVFIDGAAGTTGLEIRERLIGRAEMTLILLGEDDRRNTARRRDALNAADIVILCLPDVAAREAVALIDDPLTRVIDASSAHRVATGWTYGFAELGFDVAGAMRVTNPGCYPTGFLGLVVPLVRSGLVPADAPLVVQGTSGYSGGGKEMIAAFESGGGSAHRAYALGLDHKHVAEMTLHAGLTRPPLFLPAVARTYRGMLVELPLDLASLPGRPLIRDLRQVLAEFYRAGLVDVADDAPETVWIEERAGSDGMTLRVSGNDRTGQARLFATLDNLGKGAAGAAVQNLNLMIGLDPLAGLMV